MKKNQVRHTLDKSTVRARTSYFVRYRFYQGLTKYTIYSKNSNFWNNLLFMGRTMSFRSPKSLMNNMKSVWHQYREQKAKPDLWKISRTSRSSW